MKLHRLAVITVLFTGLTACHANSQQSASADMVPIQIAYRDSQCPSDVAKIEPIRDAATLADWWRPFANRQLPAKPLPHDLTELDFNQLALFVVFMGQRPTTGYGIELHADRALVQSASLTIPAAWREPPAGMTAAQIMTSPCIVITVTANRYETVTVRDRQGKTLLEAHFRQAGEPL